MQPYSMRSCSDLGLAGGPPVPPCSGDPRRVWFRSPKNFMIFFGTAPIREADPRLIPNSITPDELLKWIERTAEVDAVNPTTFTLQPNSSALSEATYYPETLTMTFKLAGRRDTRYVYRGVSPGASSFFWRRHPRARISRRTSVSNRDRLIVLPASPEDLKDDRKRCETVDGLFGQPCGPAGLTRPPQSNAHLEATSRFRHSCQARMS